MAGERLGLEIDVAEFDGAGLHGGEKLVALAIDAGVADRATGVVPDGEVGRGHRDSPASDKADGEAGWHAAFPSAMR